MLDKPSSVAANIYTIVKDMFDNRPDYGIISIKRNRKEIPMEMDGNNHSVFMLWYHAIFVVKYRRSVIDDPISDRLKEIFESISSSYNITLHEWNHAKDHVHILFRAHPNSEISKFVNAYKSASSRLIKTEFPSIRKALWKEYFWSRSYCLLTAGGAPLEIIKKYIESQGER